MPRSTNQKKKKKKERERERETGKSLYYPEQNYCPEDYLIPDFDEQGKKKKLNYQWKTARVLKKKISIDEQILKNFPIKILVYL